MSSYLDEAVFAGERSAGLVDPSCDVCGVDYIAEYSGPCQEPNCRGTVSIRPEAIARAAVEAADPILAKHYEDKVRKDEREALEARLLSDELVEAAAKAIAEVGESVFAWEQMPANSSNAKRRGGEQLRATTRAYCRELARAALTQSQEEINDG